MGATRWTGLARRGGLAACGLVGGLACGLGGAPALAADPPPVAAYAREPAIEQPILSPDGARVAFRDHGPAGQRVMVMPANADGRSTAIPLGSSQINFLQWIDPTHLLIVRRALVDEPPILPKQLVSQGISYDLSTGKSVIMLDATPDTAPIIAGGQSRPGVYQGRPVLFMMGLAAGPVFNLYRADAMTGRGTVIAAGSLDKHLWWVRPDGRVYAEEEFNKVYPFERLTFRYGLRGDWRELRIPKGEDASVGGLGPSGDTIVVWHQGGLSEARPDGSLGPLLQPPDQSVTSTGFGFGTGALRYFEVSGETPGYTFYDPVLERAWPLVVKAFPHARPRLIDASEDGKELLVTATAPGSALGYFWVHMATGKAESLGDVYPDVPAALIGPSTSISVQAGDGLRLTGVLTTPAGPPRQSLPLVVLVNDIGTPAARPGFEPFQQLLASRGYAVLEVNHRGVHGLGSALETAGVGQWGRLMQTDLSDAVAELGRRGLIDPKRVCIAGGGYGGYAALAGVTLQHDIYRCAVSIDGIADLGLALRRPDQYERGPSWTALATVRRYVGPTRDVDALSPVEHVRGNAAPVLLMTEGVKPDDDTAQAHRMRAALTAAGRPVQTIEVREDKENPAAQRLTMWTAMLDFLAKYNPA